MFQVGKPAPAVGGILCLSIVPNTNSKLWIGFVSSTYAGAGMLTFYRDENLDEFHQLINQYVPVK
ncbi:hypothetical protein BGP_1637 [Beggiatoa sp. PS]|nr:hypothetical protein BGP_1637 [Beggiatoa sp. PS]